jgi:hypothetical protein
VRSSIPRNIIGFVKVNIIIGYDLEKSSVCWFYKSITLESD